MNLYIFQDRLSKNYGEVLEAANDETMQRNFLRLVQSPAAIDIPFRDIVVIRLGSICKDGTMPVIHPDPIPSVILRGDEIEYVRAFEAAHPAFAGDPV